MQVLRNEIFLKYPDALIMCSMDNEEHTDGNIHEMGLRLANEITQYIEENCPGNAMSRLSLVGHSLGGIICRACLPFIVEFHHQLYLFMSFASPHLGFMYSASKLVSAGLWVIKKWKKSECLKMLTMADDKDLR